MPTIQSSAADTYERTRARRDASSPAMPSRGAPPRRGFTLTELLVALLLLDIGVLAIVACGAAAVRELSAGITRTVAIDAAQARLERLASLTCPVVASGSAAIAPRASETWSARTDSGVRVLVDSTDWLERGRRQTLVLRTRVPC